MSPTAPSSKAELKSSAASTPASAAFDKALNTFIRSTKESMESARKCAEMGLQHFAEHGNLVWLQRFHDAMPQNWTRKQAFIKWLASHAPVTMANKKFIKDTREDAVSLDLEGAFKKPFWDFAPEMPIIDFTSDDLKANLVQLVKRYHNSKRYEAADEEAMRTLKMVEGFVTGLTGEAIPHNENAPEADQAPVAQSA